jgi:hypothetical protein
MIIRRRKKNTINKTKKEGIYLLHKKKIKKEEKGNIPPNQQKPTDRTPNLLQT